jgi:hypothetical protein
LQSDQISFAAWNRCEHIIDPSPFQSALCRKTPIGGMCASNAGKEQTDSPQAAGRHVITREMRTRKQHASIDLK